MNVIEQIPHFPVPYLVHQGSSLVTWYIGLPGNNRFQIYGELEDQEIAKIKETHHLFAND